MSYHLVFCHVTFCHLFPCLVVSFYAMSCHILTWQSCVACLRAGPHTSLLWCHISCVASCRLFWCYDMSCHPILRHVSSLFPVMLCLALSSRVMSCCVMYITTCCVRSSYLGSIFCCSLALATRRKLHFVAFCLLFDLPPYCIRVRGFVLSQAVAGCAILVQNSSGSAKARLTAPRTIMQQWCKGYWPTRKHTFRRFGACSTRLINKTWA